MRMRVDEHRRDPKPGPKPAQPGLSRRPRLGRLAAATSLGAATLIAAAAATPGAAAPDRPSVHVPEADMPPFHWFDAEASPPRAAVAKNGMVACANPWAAQAGVEILEAGGNAVDAAIAVQLVLNLVEPQSSGLGGGAFMLIGTPGEDGGDPEVVFIDGREEAPSAIEATVFLDEGGKPFKFSPDRITGGRAVGVPGTLRLLEKALTMGSGKLDPAELAAPAIELAERGFPISERLHRSIRGSAHRLRRFPASAKIYLNADGTAKAEGARLRNPDFAATLRLIVEKGPEVFYEGEIADDIVAAVRDCPVAPGVMTKEDLAGYRAVLREPTRSTYRGLTLFGAGPPSSGGIAVAQILNTLEGWDLGSMQPGSPEEIHLLAEASRLTFADRGRHVGDADFVDVPVAELTSADFAAKRRKRISLTRAKKSPVPAEIDTEGRDTTHISIVDRDRIMVAFTTTIEQGWGSGSVVPGRGFLLNNELTDFAARPEHPAGVDHPNRVEGGKRLRRTAVDADDKKLEGGKRPRSSMSPTLVFRDGRPLLSVGSPGGSRIIGIVAHTLINVIDHGMDVQEAISFPRAFNRDGATELEWLYWDDPMLALRTGARRTASGLRSLGHDLVSPTRTNRAFGGAHGVAVSADGKTVTGGADPRREGVALGY